MSDKIRREATTLAVDHANAEISTDQLIDGIVELVEEHVKKAHIAHAPGGCPSCGGLGSVIDSSGKEGPCGRCGGNG